MIKYKRNQVEEAIFRTFGAEGARIDELKFRLKRMLAADRSFGRRSKSRDESERRYAFYSAEPPGSGTEVMFSGYEAFALSVGIMLLEHRIPQASVVRVMRRVRGSLETAYSQILKQDPAVLFDEQAILARAKPGMIGTGSTNPVFLMLVTDSSDRAQIANYPVAVCRGEAELMEFIKKYTVNGRVATTFEFGRLMHTLAANLSQTRVRKRGRMAV
jgi:hypothetical protein